MTSARIPGPPYRVRLLTAAPASCPALGVLAPAGQAATAPSPAPATTGDHAYHYLYVPAGTPRLTLTTTGANGDADLYYNPSAWATASAWTARSARAGSAETLTVENPPTGYVHISLHARQGFTGASLSVRY